MFAVLVLQRPAAGGIQGELALLDNCSDAVSEGEDDVTDGHVAGELEQAGAQEGSGRDAVLAEQVWYTHNRLLRVVSLGCYVLFAS